MNIVRVAPHSTRSIHDFKNAQVLSEKYGFTTEYIAKTSWECQQKYGIRSANYTVANSNLDRS